MRVLRARNPGVASPGSNAGRDLARPARSGIMAGCLTFQRPDICSTTSLESIRTSTSDAPSSAAASRPAIRPRYSATLLVAMPRLSLRSASTAPRRRRTPRRRSRPGPGLPREPPSASTMTRPAHSPDSFVAPGSRRIPGSAPRRPARRAAMRAISPRSSSIRHAPQRRACSSAAPTPFWRAAARRSASRSAGNWPTSPSRSRVAALLRGVEIRDRLVPAACASTSSSSICDSAAHRRARGRPGRLAPFHHLEQLVLEQSTDGARGCRVRAEFGELLRADRPALQHRAVAVLALTDRVDLALELADVAVEVVEDDLAPPRPRPCGLTRSASSRSTSCCSGQRGASVGDPATARHRRRRGRAAWTAPGFDVHAWELLLSSVKGSCVQIAGCQPYPGGSRVSAGRRYDGDAPTDHGSVRTADTRTCHSGVRPNAVSRTPLAWSHHGCSLAQCATSIRAGPPARRCSSAGWCRRSAVT